MANKAKTVSSRHVHALIERCPGEVRFSELRNTMIVMVGADDIENGSEVRTGAVGFDPEKVAARCDRYWGVGTAIDRDYDVRYLLAVLKGTRDYPVVGCWATHPVRTWSREKQVVKLRAPQKWNVGRIRGKSFNWEDRHPQKQQFSNDISGK